MFDRAEMVIEKLVQRLEAGNIANFRSEPSGYVRALSIMARTALERIADFFAHVFALEHREFSLGP